MPTALSGAKLLSGPWLLYAASVGLTGFASLQFVAALPLHRSENRQVAVQRGVAAAHDCLAVGRGSAVGRQSSDWRYSNANRGWWEEFATTNWTGARPGGWAQPPGYPPPRFDPAGLADLLTIELLVQGRDAAIGRDRSHVVVRYRPRAAVQPPANVPGLAVHQIWAGGRRAPADSRLWRPLDDYHFVGVEPGTRSARFGHPHGDVVIKQAEATLRPELLRQLLPGLRRGREEPRVGSSEADSREEGTPRRRR